MSISVSATGSNNQTGVSSSDSVVKQLQQKLKAINKEIQDEQSSKDTAAVKQKKLEALQSEMEMIQMQISMEQNKKAKASSQTAQLNKPQAKDASKEAANEATKDVTGLSTVVDIEA